MSDDRFYLKCPYDEKEKCKSLRGRCYNNAREWYVPKDLDRDLFKQWWPENVGSKSAVFSFN